MIRSYTAAEVAHIWRRPVGTVHRLASEHQWRRSQDRRRPTLYNADDVEATMNGNDEIRYDKTRDWRAQPYADWEKSDLMAAMDKCLIAISDDRPLKLATLDLLPPWRAVLIARVASRADVDIDHCTVNQLVDIAQHVGGGAGPGWASAHLDTPERPA